MGRRKAITPFPPPNLVPRVLFPGFEVETPHLQSQGKAPWGRGCPPPLYYVEQTGSLFYRKNQLLFGFSLIHQILQNLIFHFSLFWLYQVQFIYLFIYLFIWVLRSIIEGTKSNSMLKNNHFKQFCENSIAGYEFW